MSTAGKQALFLIASLAFAASANASYGQMRLDGVGLLLLIALTVGTGVIVDLALVARLFRYRAAVIAGSVVALAVVSLLLGQVSSPSERAGFFKGPPGGASLVVLVVTSAVFVPFIVGAPFAQYRSLRRGRRWPAWITAWIALQLALLPGFLVLAGTERLFWRQELEAARAEGQQVRADGVSGLLARADENRERIWGTGWTLPWPQQPSPSSYRRTGWIVGLATGLDASALIGANDPLSHADSAALRTLTEQHFRPLALPHVRAKLLWDALEPGAFASQLAPHGLTEMGVVSEEVISVLVERLEKYGDGRLCPGGRMLDADRALLKALIQEKGRVWNVTTRSYEMRPDWDAYEEQVDRLCRGPTR